MADAKISALTELTTPVDADMLAIVDTTANPDESKRITRANLLKVEDTPTDGHTTNPVSSNALYDHANATTDPHMSGWTMVRAYASGSQNANASTETAVTLGTENYDLANEFTGSTFTCTKAGYYQINAEVTISSLAADKQFVIWITKNWVSGGAWAFGITDHSIQTNAGSQAVSLSDCVYLEVNDTIKLFVYQTDSSNRVINQASSETFLSIYRVR